MATTKITDLTAYTDPINTDVLPIVDITSDVTKKVSIANVMKNASLGSAAAPGISFDGDPNTGIYSPGANQVAVSTDGTARLTASTTAITAAIPVDVLLGSASTPSYTFTGDLNTGVYSPGADQIAITTGGTQRLLIDSSGAVTIAGDLTVNGTTTNINTQNLVVEDKNIVLGDVATPTDVTADGGGITLKGSTDKTINWVDSTDAWTSSERFSYPLGSAAAPTLTFTGDPNTGVYSPGADQVAISTNGSERFRVNATGQVGIGGSPGTALDVIGAGTASTSIRARNDSTSVYLDANNGYSFLNTFSNHPFLIATNNTERLRITSGGLVGVGTSSPSNELHVIGSSRIESSSTDITYSQLRNTSTNGRLWTFATTGSSNTYGLGGAGYFFLRDSTAGEHRLVIDTSGRVGVGTTSPAVNGLHITNSSEPALRLDHSTTNTWDISNDSNLKFSRGGTERMRIDSSGRVGIGTSSVAEKLHVDAGNLLVRQSDFQDPYIKISQGTSTTGNKSILYFADSSGNTSAITGYGSAYGSGLNKALQLSTNGTAAVTIDSSQRVGIGTTSPDTPLQVYGASGNLLKFQSSTGMGTAGQTIGISFVQSGNVEVSSIKSLVESGGKIGLTFSTYNSGLSEAARIDSSGRLLVGTSSTSAVCSGVFAGRSDGNNAALLRLESKNSSFVADEVAGNLTFGAAGATSTQGLASITASRDGGTWTNNSSMPSKLVFSTTADGASSPTERMRIDNAGRVLIGTTNTDPAGNNVTGISLVSGSSCSIQNGSSTGLTLGSSANNTYLLVFRNAGNLAGYVSVPTSNTTTYNSVSDRRLKDNIQDASSAIESIKSVKVRSFNWKTDGIPVEYGLIAQEALSIAPEVVSVPNDPEQMMGIDFGRITPRLIKAFQELVTEVESLKAEVAALKAQ